MTFTTATTEDQPDEEPRARPRMTGSERRSVILAAARQEFARSGYHGASTARIAQAAGCSEPMLYKHFSGKQSLFTATLEDVAAVVDDQFDTMIDRPGNLFDNIASTLPTIMGDAAYAQMMRLRKLAITSVLEPDVHAAMVGIEQRHLARVTRALKRAIEDGTARPDADPEYVAWMWTGIVLAACQREALEPDGFVRMLPHALTFIDGLRS